MSTKLLANIIPVTPPKLKLNRNPITKNNGVIHIKQAE